MLSNNCQIHHIDRWFLKSTNSTLRDNIALFSSVHKKFIIEIQLPVCRIIFPHERKRIIKCILTCVLRERKIKFNTDFFVSFWSIFYYLKEFFHFQQIQKCGCVLFLIILLQNMTKTLPSHYCWVSISSKVCTWKTYRRPVVFNFKNVT